MFIAPFAAPFKAVLAVLMRRASAPEPLAAPPSPKTVLDLDSINVAEAVALALFAAGSATVRMPLQVALFRSLAS